MDHGKAITGIVDKIPLISGQAELENSSVVQCLMYRRRGEGSVALRGGAEASTHVPTDPWPICESTHPLYRT